tara:strand:- start:18188 stop:19165 length:978 start_codon:yes stop_codon:yes gene_type:complete
MRHFFLLAASAALTACSPPEPVAPADLADPVEGTTLPAIEDADDGAAAAAAPGTDIHVFQLDWTGDTPALGRQLMATARPGYDNQPFFVPGEDALLYTSDDETGETDIWRLDLASGARTNITNTPGESEYSPRIAPDGSSLSYIFQPPGGYAGNVYLAGPDNSDRGAAEALAPVGYYAFSGDMGHVAVFALGEPNTLQLIDRQADPETVIHIADEPGRSLFMTPRGNAIYYVLTDESGHAVIHVLDVNTASTSEMFQLPDGTEDFAIALLPTDAVAFFANENGQLVFRHNDGWESIGDLAGAGLTGITRIAVSSDLSRIAIVAEE